MHSFLLGLFGSFLLMEPIAWFIHKYLMHGPLWFIHQDHHNIDPQKKFQLNDFFAFFPNQFIGVLKNISTDYCLARYFRRIETASLSLAH